MRSIGTLVLLLTVLTLANQPCVMADEADARLQPAAGDADEAEASKTAEGYAQRQTGAAADKNFDRVRAALDWLTDHQNAEGFWSGKKFSEESARAAATKSYNLEFRSPGEPVGDMGWENTADLGLTGLALLAYAGAGYHHLRGEYRTPIRQAVLYLRKAQDNDGCFGRKDDDHFVYNHAMCAMAMIDLYGLSGDTVLKPTADRAVEFILKAQNPGLGWRYGVRPGINDTSVTGWMVLVLKSAKLAGLELDETKSFDDAAEWFKQVTKETKGVSKVGYDSPGSNNSRLRAAYNYEHNGTMEAIYVVSMLASQEATAKDKVVAAFAKQLAGAPPVWDHYKIDMYYWYYASLAMFHVGGKSWTAWEKALLPVMHDHQRGFTKADKDKKLTSKETLDEHGSWDAVDAWSAAGGRVYTTAMGALILETSYRYKRFEKKKK